MSFNLLDFTFIESDSGPDSGSDDERLCAQNPAGYEAGDAHNPIQISDDEEVQPHDVPIVPRPPQHLAAADCVQLIRGILTDISVEYAENEVRDRQINTAEACEELIGVLVDAQTYPKQSNNTNQAKRKRPEDGDEDEEDEESRMAKFRKASLSRDYFGNAIHVLLSLFPKLDPADLKNALASNGTLYASFQFLTTQRHNNSGSNIGIHHPAFQPLLDSLRNRYPQLLEEVQAARKSLEQRHQAKAKERAEEENLLEAQRNRAMGECLCCYDDYPLNRMVNCSEEASHLFCRDCARRYVESEMELLKCRPVCFAASEPPCVGTFTRSQLSSLLCPKTFARLEHLQQQEDIQAAGLSLSECPFCDFKADYELAVDDKEFRCLNPSCGKTSCRLCEKETHIPMSCEEAKATTSSSARQKVEEAKSEALIRRCNRCRQAFIKELGCNKMTCPKCHNTQCYVCNADLTDGYKHFDKGPEGCPLHDREGANDLRHIDEVLNAETKAVAEARAANPNLTDAELGVDQNTLAAEKEKLQRKKNQRYPRGGRAGRNQPHGAFHGMAANNPFLMAPQNIQGFQAIDGDPNHRYPAFPPPPFAPAPVVAVPNPQYHVVGQGPGYQQPLLGHQVQEQIGQQPIGNLPPQVAGQFDQQYQVQIATMRAMRAQAAQQRRNLVQQQLLQLHQGAANQNYLAANPVNQHVAANQQIEANQQIPQANPQVARANQQIAQPNPTFGDAHNIIVQQPMIPLQQLQQAMPLPQQGAPWFGPQIGGPAAPPEEGPHVIHRFGGLFDF